MKRAVPPLLLGLMAWMCWGCAAQAEAPLQEVALATATVPPPSPTIVWFPPSETPTAPSIPTQQPTPERKPGVGSLLFSDDFTSADPWNPAISEEAAIEIARNRLAIAVQPGVNAFRVRSGPLLTDFYAEITARPSLCRDADEYGLLFRAPSNVAFYAYAVACNGTSRAERLRFSRSYPLHAPVASADVPLGPPGEVRLGVWVSGPDMRFFLNGHYQFGVTDPAIKAGAVGAFARSAGKTPVTLLFSDLSVYDVNYSPPAATPTP